MTAPHLIDPAGMLGQALSQASPDLMRSLLQHVIHALLSADADTVCGAQWGQQDPQRHAQRNGYRYRPVDTRVGTIDVAIPKLRSGTYFPEWSLQRRKLCDSALITVVAHCSWREHPRAVWTSAKPSPGTAVALTPGVTFCSRKSNV